MEPAPAAPHKTLTEFVLDEPRKDPPTTVQAYVLAELLVVVYECVEPEHTPFAFNPPVALAMTGVGLGLIVIEYVVSAKQPAPELPLLVASVAVSRKRMIPVTGVVTLPLATTVNEDPSFAPDAESVTVPLVGESMDHRYDLLGNTLATEYVPVFVPFVEP